MARLICSTSGGMMRIQAENDKERELKTGLEELLWFPNQDDESR